MAEVDQEIENFLDALESFLENVNKIKNGNKELIFEIPINPIIGICIILAIAIPIFCEKKVIITCINPPITIIPITTFTSKLVIMKETLIILYFTKITGKVIIWAEIATETASINLIFFWQNILYFSPNNLYKLFIFIIISSIIGLRKTTPIVPKYVNRKLVLYMQNGFHINIINADKEMFVIVSLFLRKKKAKLDTALIIHALITDKLYPVIDIYIINIIIWIILLFFIPTRFWLLISIKYII